MAKNHLQQRRVDFGDAQAWALSGYLGAERRDADSRAQLARRIRDEYREMPGLSLTNEQAQRLFGLRDDVCQRLLDELVDDGALRLSDDGQYILNRPAA